MEPFPKCAGLHSLSDKEILGRSFAWTRGWLEMSGK